MKQLFQIDYLEFPSAEGVATRRFFREALGWTEVSYGAHYHGLEGAGIDAGVDSSEARSASILPVVRCADLAAAEREVLAAGGVVTRPAFDFPGGRRFHFRAPGGIELAMWVAKEEGAEES